MSADPGDDPHVRLLLGAYVLDALDAGRPAGSPATSSSATPAPPDYVEVAEASALLALLRAEDLGE